MNTQDFQQKRSVGVAGLFQNQMMGNNNTRPEVGKGATVLMYSDRTPYQVIEVSADGKTAVLEEMDAVADRPGLPMGHQEWKLTPSGRKSTITWRQGAWRFVTNKIVFEKSFIASLPKPDGFIVMQLTQEQKEQIYAGQVWPQNVIPGITRAAKEYNKVSIIFGLMERYYDWEF